MKSCLCILMVAMLSLTAAEANNCSTLSGLLGHLYNTDNNLFHLNRVFYPPRTQPPSFLHVTYLFKSSEEDTKNCSVKYIWAEGGFLLIQPPSIFQLTSLLFSEDKGRESSIELILPSVCKELVQNKSSDDGNCTCSGGETGLLDVMTQQVRMYWLYTVVLCTSVDIIPRPTIISRPWLDRDNVCLQALMKKGLGLGCISYVDSV